MTQSAHVVRSSRALLKNWAHRIKGRAQRRAWAFRLGLQRRAADVTEPIAIVAMNFLPTRSSFGGGNQWAQQMVHALAAHGYAVRFDLRGRVDCILAMDHPTAKARYTFGIDDIREYKKRNPKTPCIFRVNDGDKTRGTNVFDRMFESDNQWVDFTIFISGWIRDYHAERWFDLQKPNAVVYNGADPAIFHPFGGSTYTASEPLRLVTHHWSDNWNKGFETYRDIDRLIDDNQLPGTELWIIGRWPKEIVWRSAKTISSAHGALANLLRQGDVYVTASKFGPWNAPRRGGDAAFRSCTMKTAAEWSR